MTTKPPLPLDQLTILTQQTASFTQALAAAKGKGKGKGAKDGGKGAKEAGGRGGGKGAGKGKGEKGKLKPTAQRLYRPRNPRLPVSASPFRSGVVRARRASMNIL